METKYIILQWFEKTFEWYLNYNNHKYFKNIKNLEKRVGKKIL